MFTPFLLYFLSQRSLICDQVKMVPNVIQPMVHAPVIKAGEAHFVRIEYAQIICLVKSAITRVSATEIIQEAVIRGLENVIAKQAGAVTYVIDRARS